MLFNKFPINNKPNKKYIIITCCITLSTVIFFVFLTENEYAVQSENDMNILFALCSAKDTSIVIKYLSKKTILNDKKTILLKKQFLDLKKYFPNHDKSQIEGFFEIYNSRIGHITLRFYVPFKAPKNIVVFNNAKAFHSFFIVKNVLLETGGEEAKLTQPQKTITQPMSEK